MDTSSQQRHHPLFDRESAFRRACHSALAIDNGVASIVRYFQDLAEAQADPTEDESAGADTTPQSSPPTLLTVYLPSAEQAPQVRWPGEQSDSTPQSSHGSGTAVGFPPFVSELPPNSAWLAFVLEKLHLEYLKGLLEDDRTGYHRGEPPRREVISAADASAVIEQALAPQNLTLSFDDGGRALRLSLLLTLAPVLLGETDHAGRLSPVVEWESSHAWLSPGSYIVLCLACAAPAANDSDPAPVEHLEEGLTDRLHRSVSAFQQRMKEIAPLLLERVGLESKPRQVNRFLQVLERNEIAQRLRDAEHVRDEIGYVLSEYCREYELQPEVNPQRFVDRRVLDNILWQVSTQLSRKQPSLQDAQALAALQKIEEHLLRDWGDGAPHEAAEVAAEAIASEPAELQERVLACVQDVWEELQ